MTSETSHAFHAPVPRHYIAMKIIVRQATPQDWPALRALFLASRRYTFTWLATETFQLADFDTQTHGENVLLAVDDRSCIAGFISVWEPDDFIHHLHVAPGQQHRGIGTLLLNALPGWAERLYRLKCLRRNERALAFYHRHGFASIGSGTAEDGEYLLLERNVRGFSTQGLG
jgi:GNAT superfamily N-acetyltransferase